MCLGVAGYYGEIDVNKFQELISDVLDSKNALSQCPRCGRDQFSVVDKEAYIPIVKNASEKVSPVNYAVPVAIVVCDNCGYLSMHSTKALGVQDDG